MTDRRSWQVGASTCFYRRFDAQVAGLYARAGIRQVELSLTDEQYREYGLIGEPEKVGEIARNAGITLRSLHIPFSGELDWSLADEDRRLKNVALAKEYIASSARIGIKINVIHPSSEPIADSERELRISQSVKSLSELALFAGEKGVTLAVENLPRTCLCRRADEMIRIVRACPGIKVCFDTNHNLLQDNASFIREISKAGCEIVAIHVSDYDFVDERHWLPCTENSKNDWHSIIAALENANYEGAFTYEVGSSGKYSFEDLRDNAKYLFTL